MSAGTREGPSPPTATPGRSSAASASWSEPTSTAPLEEKIAAIERDLRELLRLHGELVRSEVRAGLLGLGFGLFLVYLGLSVFGLVLVAVGFALYFLFLQLFPPAGAAGAVAVSLLLLCLGVGFGAARSLRGSRSLFLPRSRALIQELLSWRARPKQS